MHFHVFAGSCLLAFVSTSLGKTIPSDHTLWGPTGTPSTLARRQATSTPTSTRVADSTCTNGPRTRQCWLGQYSVATDFDAKWPPSAKVVKYDLEISNGTCQQDGGLAKPCQLFNKQYPGPTIRASWGDTIQVTVKNNLGVNGTGIHWHGMRQLKTCTQDGVPGLTECPLSPGDTKTYTFKATQHGTTWYHSHFSSQYGEGAFGPLIIDGPASSNYDEDLGPYMVNDYYYQTAWQLSLQSHNNLQMGQPPPPADNLLVNGTAMSPSGAGKYSRTQMQKGKRYRLRLINPSVDNFIRVSLDGHSLTVISSDLIPIMPYNTTWVLFGPGQRYDVIIEANADVGNYWFRAETETACASSNNFYGRGIFSYAGAPAADPASSAATKPSNCIDESPLVPWVPNNVGSVDDFKAQASNLDVDLTVEQLTTNGQSIVVWGINLTSISVNWDKPTLEYVKEQNNSYPRVFNLIEMPNEGIWTFWIVQETPGSPVPIPHPIHLHGHDFYVLGQGAGTFDINSTPNTLKYVNPPRRDTAILPGGGWLALAFPTDNPGAWLMHCHIAWHVSDGLAVQFLEAKSQSPVGDSAWESTCANWNTYNANPVFPKVDSGLRRGLGMDSLLV